MGAAAAVVVVVVAAAVSAVAVVVRFDLNSFRSTVREREIEMHASNTSSVSWRKYDDRKR